MKKKHPQTNPGKGAMMVSIILPCLNEAQTLARCIEKSQKAIGRLGLKGEVVVADNGSVDGSPAIARSLRARVVSVPQRGYGNALKGGLSAAKGRYLIMGDADDSYDFGSMALFVEKMWEGYDMVIGNRFCGGIRPGAMPWKNRWVGNPLLTGFSRILFRSPVGDVCCGFRAMTRETFQKIGLESSGMESAVEMVARGVWLGCRIGEVPVTLGKDGRGRPSHLRPWRDGAATLSWMAGAWWRMRRMESPPEPGCVL